MQAINSSDVTASGIKNVAELTFRPLRNQRYRCNQFPEKGRLTRHEVESARNQVAAILSPHQRQPKIRPNSGRSEPTLLDGFVSRGSSYATCPNCKRETYVGSTMGRRKCDWCNQPFNAKRY